MEEPKFRDDLYRGTSDFYDRYRVPYPERLIEDLTRRVALIATGRLLDLACGTGQVTFPLASRCSEVWAVDQENEAVAFVRAKAARIGVNNVRWRVGRVEDLQVEQTFDLVTVGNAFHRLDRRRVAASAITWLRPGGHLALLWSSSPWTGQSDWQRAMAAVVEHWTSAADATDRVPQNLDAVLAAEPNTAVLVGAGFAHVGAFNFPTPHTWTVEALTGLLYSTSILSQAALGDHTEAFERDLRHRLLEVNPEGLFEEEIDFAYELFERP